MKTLQKTLLKCGLDEKEARIYLATVKVGPSPLSKIAREAGVLRQTTYSIVSNLVQRGFIEESDRAGVKQFFADPKKLLLLLERQKEALETSKNDVEQLLPEFERIRLSRTTKIPSVRYYSGDEGVQEAFEDILDHYKTGSEKKFRGYGVNTMRDILGDYLPEFIRRRGELGVETDLFVAEGDDDFEITETTQYGRKVKRIAMPKQNAGAYVAGKRLYLFSYTDKVGVVIENKAIVDLLTQAFDDHWKKSN